MKKILVIGSAVADVLLRVPHLPRTAESVNLSGQEVRMGGCAFNASEPLRRFKVPYTLFAPVGRGVYGDFVRARLGELGVSDPIPTPEEDNGCCYCFVEAGGERTFLSCHGAEYLFRPEWFESLDVTEYGAVYLCGLEVEERTGEVLLSFLEVHPELPVFFAPGPRIHALQRPRLRRVLDLPPLLHLNEAEACYLASTLCGTAVENAAEAAKILHQRTGGTVAVTLGKRGCLYHSVDTSGVVPGVTAEVTDTVGAGDAHIGTLMARLALGDPMERALAVANRFSAAVVETAGAQLSDAEFEKLHAQLCREGWL